MKDIVSEKCNSAKKKGPRGFKRKRSGNKRKIRRAELIKE